MNPTQPSLTLNEAMATEPIWLQGWVMTLVVVNLVSLLFVVTRREGGGLGIRTESVAIITAFLLAAALMGQIYEQVGYVRLLGLAHLVCWGPVWAWLLDRRRAIGTTSAFGKYIHVYLTVAGASLAIDLLDVVRYAIGDGELLNRWSQ